MTAPRLMRANGRVNARGERRCSGCGQYYPHPEEAFSRRASIADGLDIYCRACKAAHAAGDYERHGEERRKAAREYAAERRRRTSPPQGCPARSA